MEFTLYLVIFFILITLVVALRKENAFKKFVYIFWFCFCVWLVSFIVIIIDLYCLPMYDSKHKLLESTYIGKLILEIYDYAPYVLIILLVTAIVLVFSMKNVIVRLFTGLYFLFFFRTDLIFLGFIGNGFFWFW
jgi:hypothetical protein